MHRNGETSKFTIIKWKKREKLGFTDAVVCNLLKEQIHPQTDFMNIKSVKLASLKRHILPVYSSSLSVYVPYIL